MKLFPFVGSAGLLLMLGAGGAAYAQEPEEKPAEKPAEKPKAEPAKPHQEPETKPKENEPRDTPNHEERKPEERKPEERKPDAQPNHEQPAHQQPERKEDADRSKGREQHNGGHGRIPDEKFHASFGQEHHFHVGHPRVEGGRSQFAYGGYNFYYTQAWPAGWGYDDDVYIVEIDGVYYLVDAVHPGPQLQLDIIL